MSIILQDVRRVFESRSEGSLRLVDGIRAIGALGVHFGHVWSLGIGLAPPFVVRDIVVNRHWIALIAAPLIFLVDTFFFLSGAMLGMWALPKLRQEVELRKRMPIVVKLMFQRYMRLIGVVALMTVIMLNFPLPAYTPRMAVISKVAYEGLWGGCRTWWPFIPTLFHNIIARGRACECLGWVWYIDCDWQAFLFSVVTMALLARNVRLLRYTFLFFAAASAAYGAWLAWSMNLEKAFHEVLFSVTNDPDSFTLLELAPTDKASYLLDFYIKPLVRAPAYFIGVWFGLHAGTVAADERETKGFSGFFWHYAAELSLAGMAATAASLLFLVYVDGYSLIKNLLLSWVHTAWALLLIPLIAKLAEGDSKIATFLSSPLWVPLSKLSYSWYHLHFIVLARIMIQRADSFLTTDFITWTFWLKYIAISFIPAALASLAAHVLVEQPVVRLGAWIVKHVENRAKQE